MRIEIVSTPHEYQRYNTAGDWQFRGDDALVIRVSALPDKRYEYLLAIHEMVEALLCAARQIPQHVVDKWDEEHAADDDPGFDKDAPYHLEHMAALEIEKAFAVHLGVDWSVYSDSLDRLVYPEPPEDQFP